MGMAGDLYPSTNGPALPMRSDTSEVESGDDVVPNEEVMESRSHSRYSAEYVHVTHEKEIQGQLQEVFDAAERKEWQLVGVAGGLPGGAMILFWDTRRPSFGRTSG